MYGRPKPGNYSWVNQKYYLYEVTVFSRAEGQIVTNVVTDPYSLGLAADSVKSLVVDLNSPLTKPFLWNLIPKPPLASPTDIVLYELHIRDFSISDTNVPDERSRQIHRVYGYFLPWNAAPRELGESWLDPRASASLFRFRRQSRNWRVSRRLRTLPYRFLRPIRNSRKPQLPRSKIRMVSTGVMIRTIMEHRRAVIRLIQTGLHGSASSARWSSRFIQSDSGSSGRGVQSHLGRWAGPKLSSR